MTPTLSQGQAEPTAIDMILYCPNCGAQHVDAREPAEFEAWEPEGVTQVTEGWENPPHRSHLCHGCGCIWRPADVPTNGVATLKTTGKADTWVVREGAASSAAPTADLRATGVPVTVLRQHWLRAMECDHAEKRDKPHCACSLTDLGWHPSIGGAVEAWLEHVHAAAQLAAVAAPEARLEGLSLDHPAAPQTTVPTAAPRSEPRALGQGELPVRLSVTRDRSSDGT